MAYLIDRQRALRMSEIVVIHSARKARVRSQVILRDGSLYATLTRPRTFLRAAKKSGQAVFRTV